MTSPRRLAATTGDLFDSELPAQSVGTRGRKAPLPWHSMALVVGAVAVLLWGAWVTKSVLGASDPRSAFASVRLQPLVAEYVAAQARTASSEAQVTRETQAFMARLDAELLARGRAGTTILVAEAVLSKNVPDITDDVRRAVHIAAPLPAAAQSARGDRAVAR